ncbi:PLDc N-terminal domain-containing protein [Methanolobus sp. WCC4]|uniref:PLDc N-terminal domain-containing protein n=1 Tax=Methanolobus sp. WCC4 TaxID=3125784 RepID=UPI0030FBE549
MSMLANIWGLIALASVIWVIYDVLTQNKGLDTVKKVLWILVALIFGVLGAIAYYFLGKK